MSTDSSALAAIRRLVADAVEFQNDVDRFIPLHTPEVTIVNFGGRRVSGRDALTEAMRQALATPLADVTTTVEVEDIRFLRDDVAIATCVKRIFDGRDSATTALPATSGQLTYVMVEDGDRWRIASAQTTPIRA
ncbi:SgcJ/EcaC family oxidoreductase [Rhodococcus sp. UNC363MFTsu5.1]|uniref:SgcJ/EcaC family oxidoreductase n=1 Tax=Rhodococcus sp. UNC363MFTsu5.1 TaxID=1449069 RepID=UPI000486DC64|nr:SgcJ/EcaC family oxidoreductase [Rhodococcus sp. UNC363MFTsu5.1]